ncbi:MAG: cytidine deaminase [Propionibacteriaceae bacterium]|jgi:cytidine deaminase|nr:cytidine deaminase [Propionibacteriaceae bacterium]
MDWQPLELAAREAATHAYVEYSHYRVGAAAYTADGRLVTGCNVENASYGLTLCAECGLVSALHLSGGGKLAYFTCVGGTEEPFEIITPCGRCRQLLFEHSGPDLVLLTPEGERLLAQMLPQAFGPANLEVR